MIQGSASMYKSFMIVEHLNEFKAYRYPEAYGAGYQRIQQELYKEFIL